MTRSQLRQRAEAMIDELISLLDQIDGDADFEQSFPEGLVIMAIPYPHEDDEDDRCAVPPLVGRQIVTLNPPQLPVKRITARRAA